MATDLAEPRLPVDTLPCAAAYADRDGRILSANDMMLALWVRAGGAPGALGGQDVALLFDESERDAIHRALAVPPFLACPSSREAALAGSASMVEFVPVFQERVALVWLIMIRSASALPRASSGDAFTAEVRAGIAHDLRAPAQVVLGWASLLRHNHDDPARLEHALTIIESNARLQLDLLEDLLELERPGWSHRPPRREPVDIVAMAKDSVRSMAVAADERGVRLVVSSDVPHAIVVGDELHLRRVIVNLLSNSLKFTPRGGLVECRVDMSTSSARLVVRDSGHGIDGDFLPFIFDAFVQQRRSGRAAPEGVGLGLNVVRHLVEKHGGRITAESAGSGRGATFTVFLPTNPATPDSRSSLRPAMR